MIYTVEFTLLCLVAQLDPTLCDPKTVARQSPLSMGILRQEYKTQVSCIVGRFFTIWATGEAQEYWSG